MATKARPGEFDCYAKLADDEPHFVLRANDPLAPGLVEQWADLAQIGDELRSKCAEARRCAAAMREWRRRRQTGRAKGG